MELKIVDIILMKAGHNMELKVVYEVEGDFASVGAGRTLGIFETEEEATAAAKGCGSLDCAGDGVVNKRLAVPASESGRFYLLDGDQTYEIGVARPSEAKESHCDEVGDLTLTSFQRKMAIMDILRDHLHVDLADAKRMVDRVPCVIRRQVTLRDSADLSRALRDAGGTVEMRLVSEEA